MDRDRRSLLSLSGLAPLIAAFPLQTLLAPDTAAAQRMQGPQIRRPLPLSDDDFGDSPAAGLPGGANPALVHNQLQMRGAVEKLYTLVQQLKQEVDRTDSTSVLSLNLVDNAKKVEDLAKQIRKLARP
jgi:hypothetical protein